MKSFIYLIAITSCAVQLHGKDKFERMATDLHNRIGSILVNVSKIQLNLNKQLKDLDTTDFGLNSNGKIDQIKYKLYKKRSHPGIGECNSMFNVKIYSLRGYFLNISSKSLDRSIVNTDTLQKTLTYIQERLSEPALHNEIDACRKPSHKCNLSRNYTNSVNDAEKYVKANFKDLTSPDLKMKDINNLGPEVITTEIRNILLQPVTDCLNKH